MNTIRPIRWKPHLVPQPGGWWKCMRSYDLARPFEIVVAEGKTAKEAFDYCLNFREYRRFR